LAVAERFADSEVTEEKLRFAWGDARRAAQESYRQDTPGAEGAARWAVAAVCNTDINGALAAIGMVARSLAFPVDAGRLAEAHSRLVPLAYEIFGNPFRPVTFSPEWRADTAVALARQIYESRDFGAMPILADALQDAGCANEDILSHCRDPKQVHVRGCWVVDLVLGKE
jgi:hypothetical protein